MPILVSDANIFIDLEMGGLLREAFDLPEDIHVPDLLFQDELAEEHPHLIEFGLVLNELDEAGVADLIDLADRHSGISRYDSAALALARSLGCPLLTGDDRLRRAADHEAVIVHGTIWLLSRMLDEHLIGTTFARSALDAMRRHGRRLPWKKAEQMIVQRKRG